MPAISMHGSFGNSFAAAGPAASYLVRDIVARYSEGHWCSHCGIADDH